MLDNFQTYKVELNPALDQKLTGKVLLNMDSCVQGPWIVYHKHFLCWDPVVNFDMYMTGGDLDAFINFRLGTPR